MPACNHMKTALLYRKTLMLPKVRRGADIKLSMSLSHVHYTVMSLRFRLHELRSVGSILAAMYNHNGAEPSSATLAIICPRAIRYRKVAQRTRGRLAFVASLGRSSRCLLGRFHGIFHRMCTFSCFGLCLGSSVSAVLPWQTHV
jgi:hypothetical protein